MGGPSTEHEISLRTGEQIKKHLHPDRYEVTSAVIEKNGRWMIDAAETNHFAAEKNSGSHVSIVSKTAALHDIAKQGIDVAFIALHGKFGEDGTVQGLLDTLGIPYTGSGVLASALGMDKPRSLSIFRDAGFNVPPFILLTGRETMRPHKKQSEEIATKLGLPLVVKPSNHGSSIGVSIVRNADKLTAAILEAKKYSPEIMIQKFIKGREITCGVIEKKKGSVLALPPVEIVPRLGKFYDYKSKYADNGSDHFIPPPDMSKQMIALIRDAAIRAHHVIGCSGMSRTDFILDKDNNLHILEINTIPGMTATSLLPQAAASVGIDFPNLLDLIITASFGKK